MTVRRIRVPDGPDATVEIEAVGRLDAAAAGHSDAQVRVGITNAGDELHAIRLLLTADEAWELMRAVRLALADARTIR